MQLGSCLFVADVDMSELIAYLRRFQSSVATGSPGKLESAPILQRLDTFLSSQLGRYT